MTINGTTHGWSTQSEKRFLDGIGRHTLDDADPKALLQAYIAAMPQRAHWGSIDPVVVETYARNLLVRLP